MFKIVTGADKAEKSEILLADIRNALKTETPVYIIIPDQFSFEYDKLLYKSLGAKLFNAISVVSFRKISEQIIKNNGSEKGIYADDLTKQIMMYLAVKKLKTKKNARYYKKQLDKPAFIGNMLDLVKDLRQASISPDEFQSALTQTSGSLSEKLNDINQIYSDYCGILKSRELKDDLTLVAEASETAVNKRFFSGCSVIIDEFSGFSNDELKMLDTIMSQAKNTVISLTINEENNTSNKITPFENVLKTERQLVDIAKKYSIPVDFKKCSSKSEQKSKEIEHIGRNIFYAIRKKCPTSENIEITSANDFYEEIDYAASEIKKLVADNGYKYSEIAIISRQLGDYSSIIPNTFERYEIPYFMDTLQPVSQKALYLFIMSIFEAVTTKTFNTEAILRYIKSYLSKYNDYQISNIEDYCFEWNVRGDMWLSDFTAQDVQRAEASQNFENAENESYLTKINKLRSDIIEPLNSFKKACLNTTAGEICEAFCRLLEDIHITEIIARKIGGLKNSNSESDDTTEIAREFKQLWSVIMNTVRAVYENIGNEEMSLKEFYELFKTMLSQATVATPPVKLDAVTVASAERSRLASPKVVFVIGVNEGIMPFNIKENGLFTDKDKDALEKAGLNISKKMLWRIAEERFIAHQALYSPSERLYVTYSTSDASGGARRPSAIISQLKGMFGDGILSAASEKGIAFYCKNDKSAYYKFIEGYNSKTAEIASLRKILSELPYYKEKIRSIDNYSESPMFTISQKSGKGLLYPKNLNITATRLESYNKCPFSYFCQYGLKLNPIKAVEISPLSRGTIVHYCLENIMSVTDSDGKKTYNTNFTQLSEDEIKSIISQLLESFKENQLGGNFGKSKRFDVQYKRLGEVIFEVIVNTQKEFVQSQFIPNKFEYPLADKDGQGVLKIPHRDIMVNISGKIDRIDTFDEKKYLRIIDYKTGEKDLSYEEMYHGINLQMILYLLALTNKNSDFKSEFSDYNPAGVLYFPAKPINSSIKRKFSLGGGINDIDKDAEKMKNFKMKGLLVKDRDSLEAMEQDMAGKFIPATLTLSGDYGKYSKLIEADAYKKLEEFALGKVKEMAENIIDGKIEAVPTGKENELLCQYCEYWSVCGNYMPKQFNEISKIDGEILKEKIGFNTKNEGGEGDE